MHDVVAHSVLVMVVQAGGARRILDRDPARAVAAAELIERTGREALAEMRHLLGVLHAGDEHAELAPQPTLAELDALVERARAAGLPVELDGRAASGRELPAGLDLAAYRDRPGGADQRAQARRRRADARCACDYRRDAAGGARSRTAAAAPSTRGSTAAATASSACASACGCTAASWTPGRAAAAASRCARGCRSQVRRRRADAVRGHEHRAAS